DAVAGQRRRHRRDLRPDDPGDPRDPATSVPERPAAMRNSNPKPSVFECSGSRSLRPSSGGA
ncbi:MAG TPA: hypothetical protein VEZ89_01215, partial [Rubrivivax sp.]|nr:hypothetical protein [Rubrivivax sp.]